MNDTDQELLQRYARDRAEDAFAEIVRRHLNLVYSAALRQVQSPQLAKDVAQSVFNDLARRAGDLKKDSILSAWLYEVTRRTSIDVIRQETRRQIREQIYTEMNATNVTTEEWRDVLPHLDAAMGKLDSADRAALLLRFFENKSLREVGAELGLSDEAARKRVGRAVERLRKFLAARGVTVGAAGLVVLVSANAVQAAPVELVASISSTALASAPISAVATAGTGKILAGTSLPKVFVVASVGIVTMAVVLIASHSTPQANTQAAPAPVRPAGAVVNEPATRDEPPLADPAKPDPVRLLKGVLQARQRIQSGTTEFEYAMDRFVNGRKETRQDRFVASFDGAKLRFESFGKEYSYAFDEDETKQNEIVKRADSLGHEAAVQAGLLEESMAHHTLVSDGTTVSDHYESTHQRPSVSIKSVTNGIGSSIFDPRGIGLSRHLELKFSADDTLVSKGAEFLGEENLDGIPSYHIRVKSWSTTDYWLEKAYPEHLLQLTCGMDAVKSRYNAENLGDPLPVEVEMTHFRNGVLADSSRLVSSTRSYNVPIDAESFTLAGLGLAVGTDVSDDRIHRRIGYWTGSGLSENLPSTNSTEVQVAPRIEELLAVLETDPAFQ